MNTFDIFTTDFDKKVPYNRLNKLKKEELIDIIQSLDCTVHELSAISKQDVQTKLLHKAATECIIKSYLKNEGKNGVHSLMLIDIDNFKTVNDRNGHLFGDGVICEFARKISAICGKNGNIIGRVGGDEFLILVKNSLLSDVIKLSDQICCAFKRICVGEVCSDVSCSIGISCYPSDSRDFITLYEYADIALYHSKLYGKNRCSVYTSQYKQGHSSSIIT